MLASMNDKQDNCIVCVLTAVSESHSANPLVTIKSVIYSNKSLCKDGIIENTFIVLI